MKLSFLMRSTLVSTLTVVAICMSVVGYYSFRHEDTKFSIWFSAPADPITLSYVDSVQASQRVQQTDIDAMNQAQYAQDITLCDTIESPNMIEDCRDMIYAAIAQSDDVLEDCSKLSRSGSVMQCRDNIYSSRAQKSVDKKLCENIQAVNIREYCQEQVDQEKLTQALDESTLSVAFCDELGDTHQTECLRSLERADNSEAYARALEERNPALCDALTDPTFRENCHDAVVLQLAIAEKNTDYCGSIYDETKRLYCETALVMKTDSERFQDVIASGDIGQCNAFIEKKLRYQCADMINMALVRVTYDQTICGNLFNSGLQFACMQIANSNKNSK